ncbi:MAG: hypothetical protein LBL07_07060 [Tannerella sp.]|jgi:hypothetical protein|nr:hypothetical protein [Tannerella sp.]
MKVLKVLKTIGLPVATVGKMKRMATRGLSICLVSVTGNPVETRCIASLHFKPHKLKTE